MKYIAALLLSSAAYCASLPAGQYTSGQGARLIIGQATFTDQFPGASARLLGAVGGVAYANGSLFIADSSRFNGATPQNRRVLIYNNIFNEFPSATAPIDPNVSRCPVCTGRDDFPYSADVVLGQPDFNQADPQPLITQAGTRLPTAVASDGRILVVADTENNRVLIWKSIPASNYAPADLVLGQTGFTSIQQPIVISASSFRGPQGVWIQDGRLYVADTQNHRILIWRSIPTQNNQAADIVLGQGNFTTAPEPDLTKLSTSAKATALLNPVSVTSDGSHLFVTDLGFERVLIWNSIPDVNQAPADVVVGEPDMNSTVEGGNDVQALCASSGTDPNNNNALTYPSMCAATLSFPRFALSDGQRLYIADGGNDRVLIFNSIPVQNGVSADAVLGQKDFFGDQISDAEDLFNPNLQRSSANTIRTPTSLAWDGQNLYVADPFDRRIVVFTPAQDSIPIDGVRNAASLQVYAVGSINITAAPKENDQVTITIAGTPYVYKATKDDTIGTLIIGLVKVINANGGDPNVFAIADVAFNSITLTARVPGAAGNIIDITSTLSDSPSLGVTVTAPAGGQDAAKIAPGTLVTITGTNLSDVTASAPTNTDTLPTDLGGVQVYFDGIRAPLLFVSPTQINTQVPYEVLDTTSVSAYVRTEHGNSVSVSNAIGVPITLENPGIFALPGDDPRTAVSYHASSSAALSILVDGAINAGDTGTVTIEDRAYSYTVQASDTLATVRDALIAAINANPNERVTAEAGGSFARVILRAKDPGSAGNGIAVTTTTNSSASLSLSTSGGALCCGNTAGALVTQDNPAVPGEMIYIYATGLGLVTPDEAKNGLRTGQTYIGPENNDPTAFVSSLAGGLTANVISAGALPGTIGLYKVVLELNSTLPTNPATQVTIAQDIYVSNIVTLPVLNSNPPTP